MRCLNTPSRRASVMTYRGDLRDASLDGARSAVSSGGKICWGEASFNTVRQASAALEGLDLSHVSIYGGAAHFP